MMSRHHLMASSLKLNSSYSSRRGALVASSSFSSLCVSTPLSSTLSSASSRCHHRNQSTSSPKDNNSTSSSSLSSSSVHFPWRHSPTPLSRIQNNDDYSGMPNNVRAKFVRKLIAVREMNLSFLDALPTLIPGYRHEWERELSTVEKEECLC